MPVAKRYFIRGGQRVYKPKSGYAWIYADSETVHEKKVLVSVVSGDPGVHVRVSATRNPGSYFSDLRADGYTFVPVAVITADPELFKKLLDIPRLPYSLPLELGAGLFGKAVIEPEYLPAVLRHISVEPAAGRLLSEWQRAVFGAKGVAA